MLAFVIMVSRTSNYAYILARLQLIYDVTQHFDVILGYHLFDVGKKEFLLEHEVD